MIDPEAFVSREAQSPIVPPRKLHEVEALDAEPRQGAIDDRLDVRALEGREGPRIRVTATAIDDHVEIRVLDNGPGVPPELREKIFDPFFTTGAPNEGTGLGLAIAFDIVRAHGGALEYEPASEGGACFLLRLPRSEGTPGA